MCCELGEEGIVDCKRSPSLSALSSGWSRAVRGLWGGGGLYKVRSDHHAPLLSRGIGNEVFLVSVDIRKKKGADRASATPKCQPVTE